MKQGNLFGDEFAPKIETKYTSKIKAPIYEPKNVKPHILELCDKSKYERIKHEIYASKLSNEEKEFLYIAASRHIVFNYSKIADYYASSNTEMQQLMERSALVIIDFEKAIQYGFAKLNDDITQHYLNEYDEK